MAFLKAPTNDNGNTHWIELTRKGFTHAQSASWRGWERGSTRRLDALNLGRADDI
jgi:hypothetical protein